MRTTELLLFNKVDTGMRDKTNRPIVTEKVTTVSGVLIAPVSTDDVVSDTNLSGKTEVYQIAIPKGDTNDWVDARVKFWGKTCRTIGIPEEGMDENIPLKWNKKIKVERYE